MEILQPVRVMEFHQAKTAASGLDNHGYIDEEENEYTERTDEKVFPFFLLYNNSQWVVNREKVFPFVSARQ